VLVFDHARHQIHVIANVFTGGKTDNLEDKYQEAINYIESIEARLEDPIEPLPRREKSARQSVRSNLTRESFEKAVIAAKEYIAAGDIFQAVLSQRFEVGLSAHPFEVYRALRIVNPSPYMFFLKNADQSLIAASPEMLVRPRAAESNIARLPVRGHVAQLRLRMCFLAKRCARMRKK
jgi:anthranilate synthase component I